MKLYYWAIIIIKTIKLFFLIKAHLALATQKGDCRVGNYSLQS